MELTVIFEIVNVALLLFLLNVYVQNYREMKTHLGLGLIIFAGFLLLQNLIGIYFHFVMIEYYSFEVMWHARVLSGIQTVALIVLSYVTWKE